MVLVGKSVFGGVSIGKLMFYKRNEKVIRRTHVDDVDAEWKRFEEAKNTAIDQLKVLYDKAIEDVGEANAMIFEIHQLMLDDRDYLESIQGIIRTQSLNAEYAVSTTADNFAQMFASMDDAYMQGRAADVKDVSDRLLGILSDAGESGVVADESVIVAADDLVPSETVQLDKSKVLAFAAMYGSANSHTAILARTMNIPAVIGLGEGLAKEYDGYMAAIDGFTGTIYIDPDEETMKAMTEKREEDRSEKTLLEALQSPMMMAYHDGQPFNDNMYRPCPMLENPQKLREMVEKSGAHSTDLQSPESAEHLCAKCDRYAENWKPVAEEMWKEDQERKAAKKGC